MMATFEDLPPELLVKIFSLYIEFEGHMEFSKNVVPVCSTWWKLSTTSSLWKNIDVRNWNYVMSLSKRDLLHHTESLTIPGDWESKSLLYSNRLLAVLSNIRDLKSFEILNHFIDENTMQIVAGHCPNLERLRMSLAEGSPITLEELDPILTICGPTLKHLHLNCYIEDSEQTISEIAAKCGSLEELELTDSQFPIYKIMRGCPLLRKLKLSDCKFVTTGENDCSGLKHLTVFESINCNFNGLDACRLLKNSNDLERLGLLDNKSFIFKDVSKIPSNKVKLLVTDPISDMVLKQAVDKWKHTLLYLDIWGWECDVTGVFKTYLDGNQCLKLEVLMIDSESKIDQSLMKKFILKCQNLIKLRVCGDTYWNREEIMNFYNSL